MAFKKINKNGSITIPKAVRTEAGLFSGNGVELINNSDGSITIKPSVPCCRFCGSPEEVIAVENIRICKNCTMKVVEKAGATK